MNIFALEGDVKTGKIDWQASAQSHDNYRTVKMLLETCQLLSTALNVHGVKAPYKSFNPKHPSAMWAIESSANAKDLIVLGKGLLNEYMLRFGKDNKCRLALEQIIDLYNKNIDKFPSHEPTPLRLAMPNEFKNDNPIIAYRNYWATKERMRYPKDKVPAWFKKIRKLPYQVVS